MSPPGSRRVVITGICVLSAIGIGKSSFLESLSAGVSGIAPISLFDTSKHRHKLAAEVKDFHPQNHFERRELRRMDRASQMLLMTAKEAVEDAKLEFLNENPLRCGVLAGTTLGGMISGERYHRLALAGKRRPGLLLDFPTHAASDRVAIMFNLQGPSFVFSTACAASAHSIGYGFDLIRSGKADVMLVGGFETLTEFTHAGFGSLQTLIRDGEQIRPFDHNRTGFALGEGAAILVLETSDHAERRGVAPYCEIAAYAVSSDAHHMTAPDPEGKGAAKAMRGAIENAGVSARSVDYVNAHGTATKHNDSMETAAIKQVFGDHAYRLAVSSTKSMIGHTLGAAGSIELASTVLAMKAGFVPPTINYETPDASCDLNYVPNRARPMAVKIALSNSFGFGGANISILIKHA